MYVNCQSSHPPAVINRIATSVNDRLSRLSSSRDEFDNIKSDYQEALKQAGYDKKLEYAHQQPRTPSNNKNRKRNDIWYNPPFNAAVQGNITKLFSSIITRAFPRNHDYLNKLFNQRNLRLSYCTTPNLDCIVARHNKRIMKNYEDMHAPPQRLCNCRDKNKCPFGNRCLTESIVYRADVTATGPVQESKFYLGLTANSIKQRISSHNTSFTHARYRDQTSLSSYIWHLKDSGANYTIRWSVVRHAQAHRPGDKICSLCLAEKLAILHGSTDRRCLNKRNELFNKCRHKNRTVLAAFN